jgi:DHA3 family macrolide efflux protein-like MFS transporter
MNATGTSDSEESESLKPGTDRRSWRRPFFTIWTGQALSLFGSALVQFALVWWLTLETGSATILAVAMIAAIVPQVAFGPFAGALVDRLNRKKVMIYADLSIALATLVLAILFWQGLVEVWHLLVVLLARSVGAAFHWPAFMASTSLMVPKDQLARVNGMNQSIAGLSGIGAPALGAVLLAVLPMQGILAVDIVTALIAISTILMVDIPQPAMAKTTEKKSLLRDTRDGMTFIKGWPGALAVLGVVMLINFLFTPTESLLPILTVKHFEGGAPEFAAFQVSIGIGMILGGVALGIWGGFKRKMTTAVLGLALSGPSIALLGLARADMILIALAGIFAVGFFISMTNASIMAVMQSAIPPEMQGRVFALLGSGAMAMTPLGLVVAGPVSDWLGPRVWYVAAGFAILVIGAWMFLVPSMMNLETSASGGTKETTPKVDAPKG